MHEERGSEQDVTIGKFVIERSNHSLRTRKEANEGEEEEKEQHESRTIIKSYHPFKSCFFLILCLPHVLLLSSHMFSFRLLFIILASLSSSLSDSNRRNKTVRWEREREREGNDDTQQTHNTSQTRKVTRAGTTDKNGHYFLLPFRCLSVGSRDDEETRRQQKMREEREKEEVQMEGG